FFFLFTKLALKIDFGKMSGGIAFYSLFVSIVTSQGIYALFALNFSLYSILIAIGFLLFYVSDIVLMKIYFNNNERQNNRVLYYYNLGLYYAAQILIATSLILVHAI
ncbi:MAG: lysoplasmalogenase family protein, partial [Clostridia bacterium]|nr:lysoplasmalogenase family protein [Clostridia bacterium]MDD4408793.1 lysoplasmalogenase family protein [Clostridia bacterium]